MIRLLAIEPTEFDLIVSMKDGLRLLKHPFLEEDKHRFPLRQTDYDYAIQRNGFIPVDKQFNSLEQLVGKVNEIFPESAMDPSREDVDTFIGHLPEAQLQQFLTQIKEDLFPAKQFRGAVILANRILDHGNFNPNSPLKKRFERARQKAKNKLRLAV